MGITGSAERNPKPALIHQRSFPEMREAMFCNCAALRNQFPTMVHIGEPSAPLIGGRGRGESASCVTKTLCLAGTGFQRHRQRVGRRVPATGQLFQCLHEVWSAM